MGKGAIWMHTWSVPWDTCSSLQLFSLLTLFLETLLLLSIQQLPNHKTLVFSFYTHFERDG